MAASWVCDPHGPKKSLHLRISNKKYGEETVKKTDTSDELRPSPERHTFTHLYMRDLPALYTYICQLKIFLPPASSAMQGLVHRRIPETPTTSASAGCFTLTQWKLNEILANFKENTANCPWHSPWWNKQALGLMTYIIVIGLPITLKYFIFDIITVAYPQPINTRIRLD